MSALGMVSGLLRDRVRDAAIGGMRLRGDTSGRLLAPAMNVDPYPTLHWVREQGLIVHSVFGPTTAHYALADAIMRHPKVDTATGRRAEIIGGRSWLSRWLFSVPDRGDLIDPLGPGSMIAVDGADHTRLRKLTAGVFTPAAIAAMRPRVTEMAHEILDNALVGPSFDLMPTLAQQLPVWVICDILGVPAQDRTVVQRWGGRIAVDLDTKAPARDQRLAVRMLAEMHDYFSVLIDAKRRTPGGDLLSRLVQAETAGDRLTPRELEGLCFLLLLAGFETTVLHLGNGVAALMDHPHELGRLRTDPGLVPNAVEEMLRFDGPVQIIVRMPREDLELCGVRLRADVPISLFLGGANRDPAVFEDPDRFDVTRHNARKHLAFAAGPHHCLGAGLARLEAEVAFTVLLERVGALQPAGPRRRRQTLILRGYESLPLRSRPR